MVSGSENFEAAANFWRTPANVQRRYVTLPSGVLHYRIALPEDTARFAPAPQRVPLLCIHLTPNSGRVYARFIAAMGRDRIAIAADTPGFGLSPLRAGPISIDGHAAALGELLDHLAVTHDLTRVDVMGYHTGSKIALALARARPQQVRRLVLVSAPVYTSAELAAQRASLGADGETPRRDGARLQARWQGHWAFKDPDADAWFVQREVAEGLRAAAHAHHTYRAAFDVQHAEELPRIAQPILLLCPNDDLAVPTRRAAALLRNGRFVELPNWAHGFLDFHTDDAAALVREFLDDRATESTAPVASSAQAVPSMRTVAPTQVEHGVRAQYHAGPNGLLHYRRACDSNTAVPLYLLHMSPNSSRIFDALLVEMGRDREVIALDTPGFGESDAPPAPPSIEDYAACVAHLADTLGHSQIDVLGYHTGAMTAIALAVARPKLLRRVVQISCPVFTADERAAFRAEYRGRELRADGSHLVESWLNLQRFYGPAVPLEVLARNFAEGLRGGPFAPWGHRAAFDYDLAAALPKVTQPVLIVNPADDLALQTPRGLALLRDARLLELPAHAHGFIDLITHDFAGSLREFLG